MDYGPPFNRKKNPRQNSNIISKILFLFTFRLYKKGYQKDLNEKDLYQVLPFLEAAKLGKKLEQEWQTQNKVHNSQSLVRLLWKNAGLKLLLFGIVDFAADAINISLGTHALSKLLAYFQEGQTEYTKNDAYFYGFVIITLSFIEQLYKNNYWFQIMQLGSKIRVGLCSLLYRKALKLNSKHLGDISIGKIVTLMTRDIIVFENYANSLNEVWQSVTKTILVSFLLYNKIGNAALSGIAFLLILVPVQFYIGSKITQLKLKTCRRTDDRLQIMQETMSTLRIIKMYAWETIFNRKISDTRKKEVGALFKMMLLRYTALAVGGLDGQSALFLVLITYIWMGHYLTAEIVYFAVSNANTLSFALGYVLPSAIYQLSEIRAAVSRIESVLKAPEITPKQNQRSNATVNQNNQQEIQLQNVSFALGTMQLFTNVNLKFQQGLIILIGPVGSGKSTLLRLIIGDYDCNMGQIYVNGSISYASQDPWLFPSTIKQNILFGEAYEEKRYAEVLKVCALHYDLDLLNDGDNTIVEDRGINLSKGQQMRINLARAVYKNSNVYLLDDSLATLDTNVSNYIFQNCIQDFLKDKLVIFTTHNNRYAKDADHFLFIANQQVLSQQNVPENEKTILNEILNRENLTKTEIVNGNPIVGETAKLLEEKENKEVYSEEHQKGNVTFEIYYKYIKYGGGTIIFILVLAAFALHQYTSNLGEKVLSNWVNFEEKLLNFSRANLTEEYEAELPNRSSLLYLFNFVNVALTFTNLFRVFSLFLFAKKACLILHKKMLDNIINCTMKYFDNHYIGNILNRFSKDLGNIDANIPGVMYYALMVFCSFTGTMVMIILVNTSFIAPLAILLIFSTIVRNIIVKATRNLKRLESSTRSPVVGYLNASLEGLSTIRVHNVENILKQEFDKHLDLSTSAYYTLCCTVRGLGVICTFTTNLFFTFIILKFLFDDNAQAGTVGLGISQATGFVWIINWGVQQWTDVENQMTAVERVIEYTQIEQENKQGLELDDWPERGEIIYENVSLEYSGEQQILKNLNFKIMPKEKIGIVGRTGAGKSSIISSLYRLYEITGRISIDGVDIKTLALDFLRKHISIIPQDPVLFTGTIRENIDPFNAYSDEEIWNAIDVTNLKDVISTLDHQIVDGGANFSIGQKQFICLARAFVCKNKIIVMDEATANMDQETDKIINETINKRFQECTVLTVAHKLQTVLEADRVMVLDKGEIKEFDSPQNLLNNKQSLFYQMTQKDIIHSSKK